MFNYISKFYYVLICFVIVDWINLEWILNYVSNETDLFILSSFTIGFRCLAIKKSDLKELVNKELATKSNKFIYINTENALNNIRNYKLNPTIITAFKTLSKSYIAFKNNIKILLWSFVVLLRLDKFISPLVLKILSIIRITFKWIWRSFTLFNLIMIGWLFYFNTPIVTGKLILGWILDFFRVWFTSYTDTIAKFLDYITTIFEKGFNSVPKRGMKPVEYPNYGFIKEYRELFRKIRELAPTIPDANGDRWYNSLRDSYIDRRPIYNFYPDNILNPGTSNNTSIFTNTIQFMRDYWYIGAIISGVIVASGGLFFFWDPISTGMVYVGSSIKHAYFNFINYFSGRAPDSGGDNSSINIIESPNTDEFIERFPTVPTTPIGSDVSGSTSPSSSIASGTRTPRTLNDLNLNDITPRVTAPKLNITFSGGINPWKNLDNTIASTSNLDKSIVSQSPILNELPSLNSDSFKAPEGNANTIIAEGSTSTNTIVEELIRNASGASTFPQNFDNT